MFCMRSGRKYTGINQAAINSGFSRPFLIPSFLPSSLLSVFIFFFSIFVSSSNIPLRLRSFVANACFFEREKLFDNFLDAARLKIYYIELNEPMNTLTLPSRRFFSPEPISRLIYNIRDREGWNRIYRRNLHFLAPPIKQRATRLLRSLNHRTGRSMIQRTISLLAVCSRVNHLLLLFSLRNTCLVIEFRNK